MNLNTLERKGVWGVEGMADIVAEKLRDRDSITRTRIYPYQIMTTFKNVGQNTPPVVRSALEEAMEVALENVPILPGAGYVLIDISGSMKSPLTGNKPGATSKVNCCDVASLMTSSIIRKNPLAKVIGFNGHAHPLELKTCAKVMENAQFLINKVSGGTACHEPLRLLNDTKATGDWLVMISDNQSHSSLQTNDLRETEGAAHWRIYKLRNPEAKMACVDIQPYSTTQIKSGKDVLNVGGWSDAIFDVLNSFFSGHIDSPNIWVKEIESISL
jgi:60 kDa SS-A/Ro ribonucleoprotein